MEFLKRDFLTELKRSNREGEEEKVGGFEK